MTVIKTKFDRRSFLKVSAAASGGLVLGFNWSCTPSPETAVKRQPPSEWFDVNAYLSVADNGQVTIMSPNPEIGQNVKTSMPMIVAEELDVSWDDVIVKQAGLNTDAFTRQVAGGSQSIRQGWESLRMAGATARKMLVNAAAEKWQVDASTLSVADGIITNANGETLKYADVASMAGTMEVPGEVELKDPKDFKIIGSGKGNVDIEEIITGKPLFGIDTKREGMVYANVLRPPAFGMKLKSFDDTAARNVSGVSQVLQFGDKLAVLANSTWAAMQGKKALNAQWEKAERLESTDYHDQEMRAMLDKKADEPRRNDGDVNTAFAAADEVIEKVYEAPFLPHNCLEPMNFFAHVTAEKAELFGPIQTPEWTRSRIAELLGREEKEVEIGLSRMGGGFGRRLYGDFALEAAEISDKSGKPVQLVYTREDDMTAGIYRPASKYKFRASIKDGEMTGYHLVGTGVNMRNATREHNWPAATLDNYLVESHNLESNITTGAWRAPITNFLAYAEQSFADEVAEKLGKDPVQFRIDLLQRAIDNPVGELDYDPAKFIGVIKLAAEKSNWNQKEEGVFKGFSAYYSHNSYVAEVAEVVKQKGKPVVRKMIVAIDCGIVVNPTGAINQAMGGVIDGIGHAMYGDFSFVDGQPQANNFDRYRLIRSSEAPKVDIHFVESINSPTGLGEPTLPPAGGAVANAIYAATGKRLYKQPFTKQDITLG
ncbi:MAG: molybdopterin cofactor-binding domain-containing protein [Fulvivirga sp.]